MGAPSTTKCSRWILRGFKKVTVFCSRLPTNYARAGFQPKSPAYNARAGFQPKSPTNYAGAGFQPKSPQICSRRRRTIFHLLHGVVDGFDICSRFYYTKMIILSPALHGGPAPCKDLHGGPVTYYHAIMIS